MLKELTELVDIQGIVKGFPTEKEWAKIQSVMGPLPTDYIQYINYFGSGALHDYLVIYEPQLSPAISPILCSAAESNIKVYRDLVANFPERFGDVKWFPALGGLLPFGHNFSGDTLFWKTDSSNPDKWIVSIWKSDGTIYDFKGSFVEMIMKAATGSQEVNYLNENVLMERPLIFTPSDPLLPLTKIKSRVDKLNKKLEDLKRDLDRY